jgi:hypothetical protein
MSVGGYPLYIFIPLAIGTGLALWFVQQLGVLTKALGIEAKESADSKRLTAALYGGEQRLHDLGVHRTVWTIRLAFIGETACILLFAYLIYRVTEAA